MKLTHLLIGSVLLVTACTEINLQASPSTKAPREAAKVSEAQACAIGYDLAKQIYGLVDITNTTITMSPKLGSCATHAAHYLRKAGYGVDETAKRHQSDQFAISTFSDKETGQIIATAYLPGLKVSRAYKLGDAGVYATSPIDVTYKKDL